MTTKDQISERFQKWDIKNWLNIEKEINTFSKKVAQNMLALGSFDYRPEDIKPCLDDECVLGDEIYLQIVRPRLVKLDFLPKQKKQKEEKGAKKKKKQDSDDQSQQEEVEKKVEVQAPTKGKKEKKQKPVKAPKVKKQDLMKQKIVRQNFAKQIEFVFNSFSMEKLQIEFGFRQKKLQLKISTFFYIACYIRKNKVKQQLDESQVFELINILIKVHRIFKDYSGKSFLDSSLTIKVATKFVQDLKDCLDGLMQYYNYSTKQVIVKYPKLVYYTIYDQYFPTLDIKPYKSQIDFADTVRAALTGNKPTLIFYKTMIGSGKTSASISIANMIRELKLMDDKAYKYLQLIYCCIIKSVRSQVGKLAYNQKLKFALGAMDSVKNPNNTSKQDMSQSQRNELQNQINKIKPQLEYFPRIVNSFSCRDEKIVDLIVSDLYTTREFFSENKIPKIIADRLRQEGRLERENVILFLDEPTAFCGPDSAVTKKIFEIISQYPPKVIVFASATMPQKEQLQKMISLIRIKNPGLEIKEIESKEFQIGCQFCTFEGDIIYPHSNVTTKQKLIQIIKLVEKNPFLMRLYTGPSLFALLDKCRKCGIKKGLPKLQNFLEIRQTDILRQTLNILNELKNHPNEIIQEVCKVDKELMNITYQEDKEEQQEIQIEKKKEKYVNLKKLLKGDAYKFLGGCLIATSDPITFAKSAFEAWIDDIPPIKKLLDRYEKDHRMLQQKLAGIEQDKNMRADEKMKKKSEVMNEFEPKFDFPDIKRINTMAHYHKYCKNKNLSHNSMLIKPIIIENVGIELFSEVQDWMIKLLFCGVAVYSRNQTSSLYLNKVEQLASANFLAYIICDQSLCYGTNFPISNVILRDDLADKLSMNEMFQLIGRAGRVGQSWTARAFLEKKGVKKLQEYILNQENNKLSPQSQIFETFAQNIIQNPKLELKNSQFAIARIPNQFQQTIQIIVKKQGENKCHLHSVNGLIVNGSKLFLGKLLIDQEKKQLSQYKVFGGQLLYEDLPVKTIQSTNQEKDVLDVQAFYKDSNKFVEDTLKNAIKRIVSEQFADKIQNLVIKNKFETGLDKYISGNRYNFYLTISNEHCFNIYEELQYEFRDIDIESNNNIVVTEKTLDEVRMLVEVNRSLYKLSIDNINVNLEEYDYKLVTQRHNNLLKYPSYRASFEHCYKLFKNLNLPKQHWMVWAFEQNSDYININSKNYCIDRRIREYWPEIKSELNI